MIYDNICFVMNVERYIDKLEDLTNKKVLVTGGTSGIGLAIVKALLNKNATTIVLARNLVKANSIKEELLKAYPNNPIGIIEYDQGNRESVVTASELIAKEHADFYAIILNAGIFQTKKKMDYVYDVPQTINTNFVGLDIFLDSLLSKLDGSHRFILQGSLVADFKPKKITSLKTHKLSSFQQYALSKCGVESLFSHYSQTYKEQSFYLVEPGVTSTDIIRDFPNIIRVLGKGFLKVFSHSNQRASLTALLALQSNIDKDSYIVPRGLFTTMGYPKIKKFPKRRERPYLYDLLKEL